MNPPWYCCCSHPFKLTRLMLMTAHKKRCLHSTTFANKSNDPLHQLYFRPLQSKLCLASLTLSCISTKTLLLHFYCLLCQTKTCTNSQLSDSFSSTCFYRSAPLAQQRAIDSPSHHLSASYNLMYSTLAPTLSLSLTFTTRPFVQWVWNIDQIISIWQI